MVAARLPPTVGQNVSWNDGIGDFDATAVAASAVLVASMLEVGVHKRSRPRGAIDLSRFPSPHEHQMIPSTTRSITRWGKPYILGSEPPLD